MANILINANCNKNCSFCFENNYKKDYKNISMNENDFSKAVNFIVNSYKNEYRIPISILGGEPLIHPLFNKFISILDNVYNNFKNLQVLIITNGIEIENKIDILKEKSYISYLVNLSEDMDVIKQVLFNFNKYKLNYTPSITINRYINNDIIDFILKESKLKTIRAAVAYDNTYDALEYYSNIKHIALDIYKKISNAGFNISIDCTKIPQCMFTEEEQFIMHNLPIIHKVDNELNAKCTGAIDILPDLKVKYCMPTYDMTDDIYLDNFDTVADIHRYFDINFVSNIINGRLKNCAECHLSKTYLCFGGCLGMNTNGI